MIGCVSARAGAQAGNVLSSNGMLLDGLNRGRAASGRPAADRVVQAAWSAGQWRDGPGAAGSFSGGRPVAVKVIRPELADSPHFRRRFAREVAAARRVGGVFTAPVVDADPEAPQPWLVTAYVDGPSLADHVENNGAMPESDVIRLGCALAEGLAAIHAAGIVHRDLKPSNVLLASDGPRIIDFGISRATEATSLTQSGLVVGSPGFMSPEQAEGREVNAASDVFSLGAVLAFVATGTGPFGTGAASAMLYRVVHAEPDLTSVSGGLRDVVRACLRKNPAERPTPACLLTMLVSLGNRQPLPASDLGAPRTPGRMCWFGLLASGGTRPAHGAAGQRGASRGRRGAGPCPQRQHQLAPSALVLDRDVCRGRSRRWRRSRADLPQLWHA